MSWVYVRSEPELWTVGHYDPSGEWHPDSDHGSPQEAGDRCAYLNGGSFIGDPIADRLAALERRLNDLDARTPRSGISELIAESSAAVATADRRGGRGG